MADVQGAASRASSEFAAGAAGDGLATETIQMSAYAKNHCKNCQLPLVEGGRAYELGGYRWHVECFRCSICSSQMDADTNMLVLGNGTLVCHNCSYFCALCQKKIEDLAILTNDQAFCADCFVCRNCQRRIDDLKYARTSQGIFCMSCHNALMARKQRKAQVADNRHSSMSSRDKDLPGLPSHRSRPSTSRTTSDLSFKSDTEGRTHTRTRSTGDYLELPGQEVPPAIEAPSPTLGPLAAAPPLGSPERAPLELAPPEPPTPSSTVLGVPIQLESPPSRSPERPARSPGHAPPPPPSRYQPTPSPAHSEGSVYSPRAPISAYSPAPARPTRSPTRSSLRSPGRSPTRLDEVPLLATPGSAQPQAWTHDTPSVTAAAPSPQAYAAIASPHTALPDDSLAVPVKSNRRAPSPSRSLEDDDDDDDDDEWDASGLMQALIRARERISELELLLEREINSNRVAAAAGEDAGELSRSILERRQTLAGLEARQKVASEELRATRAGADADEFLTALSRHKATLQGEIETLTAERDTLRAAVGELAAKRDQALEESSILNAKNSQLVDMNNELLKQTIEKFGPNTLWSSGLAPSASNSTSSTAAGAAGGTAAGLVAAASTAAAISPVPSRERRSRVKRKEVASGQTPGARAPPDDFGVPYSDVPRSPPGARYDSTMVTVLDAPQKQRKNLWPFRRPGKGLTRVFAQEVTVGDEAAPSSSSAFSAVSAPGSSAPGGQPMLGELLEARCAMDQAPVPRIVTRCLAEVEKRGLDMEGIYRKSGSKLQIDQILEYFESDSELLESDLEKDISAVTSAVKQYLRYLADPIIPYAQYAAYVQAGRKHDLSELYMVVKALPPAHYATLETLVQHLALVATNGAKNLMTSRNLAVVFAPTLARDQTGEREVLDMQARNDATQMLIDNHDMFE